MSTANLKALGVVNTAADAPDAHLSFSKDLSFSYSRVGGTMGWYDFITVASTAIGHALGFTSGVDSIDYCLDHASGCGLLGRRQSVRRRRVVHHARPVPLFRARQGTGPSGGWLAVFLDQSGCQRHRALLDRQRAWQWPQASHFPAPRTWDPDVRPAISAGTSYDADAQADLLAFDAIGWDVATAVPSRPPWPCSWPVWASSACARSGA